MTIETTRSGPLPVSGILNVDSLNNSLSLLILVPRLPISAPASRRLTKNRSSIDWPPAACWRPGRSSLWLVSSVSLGDDKWAEFEMGASWLADDDIGETSSASVRACWPPLELSSESAASCLNSSSSWANKLLWSGAELSGPRAPRGDPDAAGPVEPTSDVAPLLSVPVDCIALLSGGAGELVCMCAGGGRSGLDWRLESSGHKLVPNKSH